MQVLQYSASIERAHVRLVARGRRDLALDFTAADAISASAALANLGRLLEEGGYEGEAQSSPRPRHEVDARGYPVPEQNQPGYRKGKRNPARGRKFPADPPTPTEIVTLITGCPATAAGRRLRALIALLWRSGLRIHEALLLLESDLDPRAGSITVRRGKGGKRRVVGMDQFGWEQLALWMSEREKYPIGPVFCVVQGPTAGVRAVQQTDVRSSLHRIAKEQGIRKRCTPHQFRHGHACELVREGARLDLLQRQLGHSHLGVTTTYLVGVDTGELLNLANTRQAPMIATPDVIGMLTRAPERKQLVAAPEPTMQAA